MNHIVREKLKKIIEEYGDGICDDISKCEEVLKEQCREYKKEIFVLINAQRESVAFDLVASKGVVPVEVLIENLISRLKNNLAFSNEVAIWAVESWVYALGINSNIISLKKVGDKQLKNDKNTDDICTNSSEINYKKDPFETCEEFNSRIKKIGLLNAGKARLIKEEYNIDTGEFPLEIEWFPWLVDKVFMDRDTYHISAERDFAKRIYKESEYYPVYIELDTIDKYVYVDKVSLDVNFDYVYVLSTISSRIEGLKKEKQSIEKEIERGKELGLSSEYHEGLLETCNKNLISAIYNKKFK